MSVETIRTTAIGRHRLGRPGLAHRRDLLRAGVRSRAQHRRAPSQRQVASERSRRLVAGERSRCRVTAEGVSLVVAMIAVLVIAVSGWYAASGASAVVQMLAR